MRHTPWILLIAALQYSHASIYDNGLEDSDVWKTYPGYDGGEWEGAESAEDPQDPQWYAMAMQQMMQQASAQGDLEVPRARTRAQEALQQPGVGGPLKHTGGSDKGEDTNEKPPKVKTDAALPSYCNPPNPCPVGMKGSDGCQEEGFVNTAEYVKHYQGQQECECDRDHMRCDDAQNQPQAPLPADGELLAQLEQAQLGGGLTLKRAAKKSSDAASHFLFRSSDLF